MNATADAMLKLWFSHTRQPVLLLENDLVTQMNPTAQQYYQGNLALGDPLNVLLPDFSNSITGEQQLTTLNGTPVKLELIREGDAGIALAVLRHTRNTKNDDMARWLTHLHRISKEISDCASPNEVYRYAVDAAKRWLDIDRIGLMLINADRNEYVGTWGTDESGATVDESNYLEAIPNSPWVAETLRRKDSVAVWEDIPLMHYGQPVGLGWNAMAALWDGDTAIGWIACDNLLKQRPMTPEHREIIRLFASLLAQTIVRKQAELALKQVNEHLEQTVAERTDNLNQKIKELEQTQQKLMQAEKRAALAKLVVGVAHEINTPLAAVLSNLHALADYIRDIQPLSQQSPELQALVADMPDIVTDCQAGLQRIQRITLDLQGFSAQRLEGQHQSPLDPVIAAIGLNAVPADIKFDYQTHGLDDIWVAMEANQLTKVLQQVVDNSVRAIKDAKPAQGKIDIQLQALSPQHIKISISDNGCGMTPEVVNRAIDPFFTTRPVGSGTGLGLSVVASLLQAANGSIELASQPGYGSTVSILLPAKFNKPPAKQGA